MLRTPWSRAVHLLTIVAMSGTAPAARADGTVCQHFPADQPVAQMRTAWRVVWDIAQHAGGSEILYIKEAYFRRGPDEPEIKVLGDCRLAEIFLPYNDGTRLYDITGYHYGVVQIQKGDLGPACITPGVVYDRAGQPADRGYVGHEVHDGQVRWMNAVRQVRRGQGMTLWSALDASNYRYLMLYGFRDDGQVSFRLGATGHNLLPTIDEPATHLHVGCWRVNIALGDQTKNVIQLVRYVSEPGTANPKMVVAPFNQGRAGRALWKPDEFTRLRVESSVVVNGHQPAHPIGYELIPVRTGSARLFGIGEEFTQADFWVTRANDAAPELRYRDVPSYIHDEPLAGAAAVLWHQAPLLHIPRDEDFGKVGYQISEGVALTVWAGFELTPRNFFASTPLYP